MNFSGPPTSGCPSQEPVCVSEDATSVRRPIQNRRTTKTKANRTSHARGILRRANTARMMQIAISGSVSKSLKPMALTFSGTNRFASVPRKAIMKRLTTCGSSVRPIQFLNSEFGTLNRKAGAGSCGGRGGSARRCWTGDPFWSKRVLVCRKAGPSGILRGVISIGFIS